MTQPLFRVYPGLKGKIPHVSLGNFPTPVEHLSGLEKELNTKNIFIKRDDKCSDLYGGNKVRPLEFILGEALHKKAVCTINAGYTGSNQTMAGAVYANKIGMKPVSVHLPQPNARYVRNNLLYQKFFDAEFYHFSNKFSAYLGAVYIYAKYILKTGKIPFLVPFGSAGTPGVIGTAGAVFELQKQIEQGQLPEIDRIYLPLGSCCTAAGVALGLKATGMKAGIVGVKIIERNDCGYKNVKKLFKGAAKKLKKFEPSFPDVELREEDIEVVNSYIGDGYAHFSKKGMDAVKLLSGTDGIQFDGTYTGKALACLMDHAKAGRLDGKVTLFWNTLNSADFNDKIKGLDYKDLPKEYHSYFESDFQHNEIAD